MVFKHMTSRSRIVSINSTGDGWSVSASAFAFQVIVREGRIEIHQGQRRAHASIDTAEANALLAALERGDVAAALEVFKQAQDLLEDLPTAPRLD